MPEPLAPSPRLNGAVAAPPEPPPSVSVEPESIAFVGPVASDEPEHEFWERRFDDPPRPAAERRSRGRSGTRGGAAWRDQLADRARDLLADTRVGVVVLVVVAVAAGFVWYRMGAGGEAHGAAPAASPASAAARTATTGPTTTPTPTSGVSTTGSATKAASSRIVVHVAGAVTKPGVVELPAGSRVIDAIEAVGGALADGDLDRLNLAAKLADGERIFVRKPGVADPGAGTGGTVADGGTAVATPGGKVNLNTATQAQLEGLPGVGPAFAQAILAERQRRGGFASVNDLRSVRGIGEKRFADLAPLVTV